MIGWPFKRRDRYFYLYSSVLQNQSVLHVQDSLEAGVFLAPNLLSDDGTVALTNSAFCEDGVTFAYGFSTSGFDWNKTTHTSHPCPFTVRSPS